MVILKIKNEMLFLNCSHLNSPRGNELNVFPLKIEIQKMLI